MGRRILRIPLLVLVVGAVPLCGAAPAQDGEDARLRQRVLESIDRAQQFLISRQQQNGSWDPSFHPRFPMGTTALPVLALLNSGLPANHPAVARGLEYIRRSPAPESTYELSTCIMALAAAGQSVDTGRIGTMAGKLSAIQRKAGDQNGRGRGAWGYGGSGAGFEGWWDNSNSQFAVLGLREAAFAGIPVDDGVWRSAQDHWMTTSGGFAPPEDRPYANGWQYTDGRSPAGTGSMTAAGVASLSITSGFLRSLDGETADGDIDCCAADPADLRVRQAIEAGNRWLTQNFRVRSNPGAVGSAWLLYYLYGLERAGRLTGTRFYGDNDWYRQGARFLVETQDVRWGSWTNPDERDPVVATSLALLFLSKGLSPVLINKLKFGPRDVQTQEPEPAYWNLHPRDVSNLCDYISGREKWPRLVTWQVLDLKLASQTEGVSALLQAPVQFLCGRDRLDTLSEAEVLLLRDYLAQGGFLFAVQGCESTTFDTSFRELIPRLFPDGDLKLRKLPATHDIYRSEFVFEQNPPELWGVDVGCRTAIVYAPFDHACRWDRWMKFDPPRRHAAVKTQITKSMQLATNVVAYATGRELADRLNPPSAIDARHENPLNRGRTVIARLRHTGGFDTAPHALQHARLALEAVGIELSPEAPTIPATDPTLFDYPLLYMHGRKNFALTEAERDKLREYLLNGGFLFADASCGVAQFDASFRQLMQQVFGRSLERIPIEHDLFHNPLAHDIRQVRRRIPMADAGAPLALQESRGAPVLEGILVDGRYAVVYSKYDLSCALERQAPVSCAGYPREEAAKIIVNIVLYGLSH